MRVSEDGPCCAAEEGKIVQGRRSGPRNQLIGAESDEMTADVPSRLSGEERAREKGRPRELPDAKLHPLHAHLPPSLRLTCSRFSPPPSLHLPHPSPLPPCSPFTDI